MVFSLSRTISFLLFVGNAVVISGWGTSDKIRLTDVSAITLQRGRMSNSRRTHPVPQLKCVGGSAGCSSFTPKVVQCYNRGSDGYDVQWECKTDMDSQYRFGDISVSCEGYDYPDDPYILKGSCGLEYTIDYVGGGSHYHDYRHDSGYRGNHYHGSHHKSGYFSSGSWFGTIVMWAVIALIAYYIFSHLTHNQSSGNPSGGHAQYTSPPPAGFRPEYMPGGFHTSSSQSVPTGGAGFWSGAATGGVLGYLFGSSGRRSPYYGGHGYYGPTHRPSDHGFGGGSWFGSNNSWSSGWSSGNTYRRSPDPPSTRTASGFGGTKRR